MFTDVLQNNSLKISRTISRPQNCNVIKKRRKHLFCVEDVCTAGSETPVCLFKNTFFNRTSPVATSDSFPFPACSFIKKRPPEKMLFCEICNIFRTSFYRTPPDDSFLCLPLILRSFSDHLFFGAPLGNSLSHVQPPDKIKRISQVLFKHLIRKRYVAIRRRLFT